MPEIDHVGKLVQQSGHRKMNAIGRRAVDELEAVRRAAHGQRPVERQRVRRAAAIAFRRDDRQLARAVRARPRDARGPARSSRRRWRGGCASDWRAKASRALRGARHFDLALCHWWPAQDHEPVAKRIGTARTVQRHRARPGDQFYPLLRRPAARPLIVRWIARCVRTSVCARAIAAQQLDLEVIERIEVRKAVADASRERRIVVEQRRLLRDREEVRDRAARARRAMRAKIASRTACVGHELGVSRRDGEIGLREHHRPCSTASLRKNGQRACMSASSAMPSRRGRASHASTAMPKPYQPGQHQPALAPAEHPRDRAQVLDPRRRRARRRPAADLELGDLGDRRRRAEVVDETPASRTRARGTRRAHARDSASIVAK